MEGVIYMYTSPSGKKYIGQTIEESKRRSYFLNPNLKYGGEKIDRARRKYGPENFDYKILIKVEGDTNQEIKDALNPLEIGLIRMFDTQKNGYNTTEGGKGTCGWIPSEQTKEKISNSNSGKKRNEEAIKKISESHKGQAPWNKGMKTGQIPWNKGTAMSEEDRKIARKKAKDKYRESHRELLNEKAREYYQRKRQVS